MIQQAWTVPSRQPFSWDPTLGRKFSCVNSHNFEDKSIDPRTFSQMFDCSPTASEPDIGNTVVRHVSTSTGKRSLQRLSKLPRRPGTKRPPRAREFTHEAGPHVTEKNPEHPILITIN